MNDDLGSRLVVTFLFVVLAGVLTTMWCCNRLVHEATRFDGKMHRSYKSLRVGMMKQDVFRRMGKPPLRTNTYSIIGYTSVNENECIKTNDAAGSIFYTWDNGIDWYYYVGFSTNGHMTAKRQGGS